LLYNPKDRDPPGKHEVCKRFNGKKKKLTSGFPDCNFTKLTRKNSGLMKRIIIVLSLLACISADACSQWYVKQYNVQDISLLNEQQLEESLRNTRNNVYYSLITTGVGGVVVLLAILLPYEETEESTFIEQLLGEKNVNNLYIAGGVAIAAGGIVAAITYLARMGTIRSELEDPFSSSGSFSLEPAIFIERSSNNILPGLTMTFRF
jgi:hypothetical protein